MAVRDCDVSGPSLGPHKADSVLVVDPGDERAPGQHRAQLPGGGVESSALTTDTATTSNPRMAADAPALVMKKLS